MKRIDDTDFRDLNDVTVVCDELYDCSVVVVETALCWYSGCADKIATKRMPGNSTLSLRKHKWLRIPTRS